MGKLKGGWGSRIGARRGPWEQAWVPGLLLTGLSPPCTALPERTLMLPLTEGSLRLRADDVDSLTSEDSFFSATEVIWLGAPAGGK